MTIHPNALDNLTQPIYMQACSDYKKAYKERDIEEQQQIERFFKSKWCDRLCGSYVVENADDIMSALENQVDYAEWRKSKKCSRCSGKYKECIHYSGEHWTTIERGELQCEKELETIEH